MSALLALAGWLAVNAAVVLVVFAVRLGDVLRDVFAAPDRRRHIAVCREREEYRRLCVGAARDEAWALQLDELLALPTGKPGAW